MLRQEHATDDAPWLPTEVWLAQVRRGAWGGGEGTGKPVEPMFNPGFLPYSCVVCKRGGLTKTSLTRCAGCKLVRYCGKAHARAHWRTHKRGCKALAALIAPTGKSDWASAMMAARVTLDHAVEDAEARDSAVQLWIHQPRCAVCFDTKGPFKLCTRCKGVAYCAQHKETAHDEKDCDAAMLEQCCYGMISDMGSPLAIASKSPARTKNLPDGWKGYFEQKLWDFEVPEFMLAMGPPAAMVTDALSLPLLVVRALRETDAAVPKRLVVHCVGASIAELFGAHRFREIFAWLPEVEELSVVLVGPALPARGAGESERQAPTGDGSAFDHRPFSFSAVPGFYQDVRGSLGAPDVAVAQHSGVHDVKFTDDWLPAVDALIAANTLAVFSGYNAEEIDGDAAVLERRGANIVLEPHKNPFRGLRPFAEIPGAGTGPFYYANQYALAFKGASPSPPRTAPDDDWVDVAAVAPPAGGLDDLPGDLDRTLPAS